MDRREHVTYELKKVRFHTGWTQEEVAHKMGISRTTVQLIEGGGLVKKFTAGVVRSLLAEHTPIDWPENIHRLREEYASFERTLPRDQFKRYLNNLEHLLEGLQALNGEDIKAAGYLWLLAWIAQDQANAFKEDPKENLQKALSRYERLIDILSTLVKRGEERYAFLLDKAKLAQWVCFFSSKEEGERVNDQTVKHWIITHDLVSVAYACASREPYEWSAIRNGLVMASILQQADDCAAFHKLLIETDANFADLDFSPNKWVLPLSKNSDVKFFIRMQSPKSKE